MRTTILIFFGPPGSGKGTQSDMLGEKLKLPVVSPGELLRYERDIKTKIGIEVDKNLAKGKLAPDKIVEKIIDKRLAKRDAKKGFIFDGYPRRRNQLKYLIKRLKKITDKQSMVYAVLVDVSGKEVKKRLGGRRVCSCGESYHIKYNPPKKKGICDLCGRRIYTRDDDRPKVINARLKLYREESAPLLDYWAKNDKLIKIDGEQRIEKVFKDIVGELRKVVIK